jgi:hypothetical protein
MSNLVKGGLEQAYELGPGKVRWGGNAIWSLRFMIWSSVECVGLDYYLMPARRG